MGKRPLLALTGALLVTIVTACSSSKPPPSRPAAPPALGEVVPVQEPPSRYGNPATYQVFGKTYKVATTSEGYRERGIASWYGEDFHGKRTSSGTPYDMYALSAAHKSLPLPTYVRVTNLNNGRQVVVRVDDRGPFVEGRIIDLSYSAAQRLGMIDKGTARVEVEALTPYQYLPGHQPRVAATTPAPRSRTAGRMADLPGVRSVVTTV
ncbi:MAG: septal ring lytic transglycosylase RlpA family protein, partial [Candidatus Competibacteraceae bacterium]|nr:septal ring lytic transglycosylase RlpA family protein [Candidatus Competibacteraceae bacterium]